MNGKLVQTPAGGYVCCADQSGVIASEQDVLDLLACCSDIDSNRILLDEGHLPPDFFDLKTGLAGAILQKFANYYVKAAIVVNLEGIASPRFRELIYECNKGDQVRFFDGRVQAEEWLTG
jgi:PadR family transcriptional regulator, regulatory protein AphA